MSEKDFVRMLYIHVKSVPGEFNSAEEQCPGRINWGYSNTEVIGPGLFSPLNSTVLVPRDNDEHEVNHVNQVHWVVSVEK
jgi:hypothetical protein